MPITTLWIRDHQWHFQKTDRDTLSAWPDGWKDPWISTSIRVCGSEWSAMTDLMTEARKIMLHPALDLTPPE